MKKLFAMSLIIFLVFLTIGHAEEGPSSNNFYDVGDRFFFGQYEQDGNSANGNEPISWLVLCVENDRALVVSEKGLEAISYGPPMDADSYTDSNLSWETSSLREWLNAFFLKTAFSEDEQACILQSKVITSDAAGTIATNDRLFCLSIGEAELYFASDKAMACEVTEEAKKGLHLNSGAISDDGYGGWLLRNLTNSAKRQNGRNEAAFICGVLGTQSARKGNGEPVFCNYLSTARPAMWVDLTNEKFFALTSEETTLNKSSEVTVQAYTSLKNGASGEEVKLLQERLNELHYTAGSPDGIFGRKTENAVAQYQKINGLESTGIADAETQSSLYAETAVCNLEMLEGISIVDRIAPFLADRDDAVTHTETYTYEQYSNLEDYFSAFEISNPEDVSINSWYFSLDENGLTAYDEWKYIHVTYPEKGAASDAQKALTWEYKMFTEIVPDLIGEASDKGYRIIALDYYGDDITDEKTRQDLAVECEGEIRMLQSVIDTQNALNALMNGKDKLTADDFRPN